MIEIRALIVEDEPDLREVLVTILEIEGVDCRACSNGKEAIEQIEAWKDQWNPNVIISDITMPEMNGFELLETLNKKNIKLPFYFMSGHSDNKLESDAKKLGAIGILTKPIRVEDVLVQLKEALKK